MAKKYFTTALLISTYNTRPVLRCTLETVLRQSVMPDEVIIADDGSTDGTDELVKDFGRRFSGKVSHIWQPNKGFRKSMILNKAIVQSDADYIITIDNDVLLHPKFICDHVRAAKRGCFVVGRRSYVAQHVADEIIRDYSMNVPGLFSKDLDRPRCSLRIPLFTPFCYNCHQGTTKQIMGSNMAFWKSDFMAVNGFEEEFEGWGSEDLEFVVRLMNAGVVRRSLQYGAVQWHLNHPLRCRPDSEQANHQRFIEAQATHKMCARVGADRYITE